MNNTTVRRYWRRIGVVLLLLLLGACSGTTFMYNRLDYLLPRYLNGYADLDRDQKRYLRQRIDPFLDWHRNRELPEYVAVIDGIETKLQQPLTTDDVALIFDKFETAWLRIENEALDWLLDLGDQMSDAQIAGFLDALWKKQREHEEEYLERSDEQVVRDNHDRLVKSAREYLGSVSEQQREQLRGYSERMLRSDAVWLQERARWIEELTVLLDREPGWQERVRESIRTRPERLSPEYVIIVDHNRQVLQEAVATLLNERSARQDQRLQSRLVRLRRDLNTLISQGSGAARSEAG